MMSEIKIGDTIQATFQALGEEPHTGKVIRIIEPYVPLTERDITTYYNIDTSDVRFTALLRRECPVSRLVIRRDVGDAEYDVVPTPSDHWRIVVIKSGGKEMEYLKCRTCQYLHCENDLLADGCLPVSLWGEGCGGEFYCNNCGRVITVRENVTRSWEVVDG